MLSTLQRSLRCGSSCVRTSRPALAVQKPRFRSPRPLLFFPSAAVGPDTETPSSSTPVAGAPTPPPTTTTASTTTTDAATPAAVETSGEAPTTPAQEYPAGLLEFKEKYLGFMDKLVENRRLVAVAVAVADVAFLWFVIKGAKMYMGGDAGDSE